MITDNQELQRLPANEIDDTIGKWGTHRTTWESYEPVDDRDIYNKRKKALDISLKILGAGTFWALGNVAGEALDLIPYINDAIPQAINFVSGINVQNKIHGLVGIIGGIYGFINSGSIINGFDLDRLETIYFGPFYHNFKN